MFSEVCVWLGLAWLVSTSQVCILVVFFYETLFPPFQQLLVEYHHGKFTGSALGIRY